MVMSIEHSRKPAETLRRLGATLRPEKRPLTLTAAMVVGAVTLDLLGPLLLGRVIDRIVQGRLSGLWFLLAVMLLAYAASAALSLLQARVMAGTAQRVMKGLRASLFDKVLRLPLRFFDTRIHGELMSRLTSDVESINQVLSNSVTQIVTGVLSTLAVAVAMFFINPWLAWVSVFAIALPTVVLNRWLAARTRALYRLQQAALGQLYACTEETLGGQKIIKACGREADAIARFDDINHAFRRTATAAQTSAMMTPPLMNTINSLALAVVAGLGGYLAIRGHLTIGAIAVFIAYTRQFGRPLNEIANLYNTLQSALAGAERVFEIMDEPPEPDAPDASARPALLGDVVFDRVTFAYRPEVPVLKNVSFRARPGQTIALIGPTGAGKTTLVNLLTRFYELDGGRILIDGRDLRDVPKDHLRSQLGIVLQDTFLFAGTVRDNIRYGRLDADEAAILQAARLANADTFIHRLPAGYDTVLTERGGNLSHGQRQMLAIARAILADPAILILDEATSSVDTRTEKHIQEAMHRLMQGRTSFVIAHRLSTIRGADQILVINQGGIQEQGTHAELLAKKGFYWRISGARHPAPAEIDTTLTVTPW